MAVNTPHPQYEAYRESWRTLRDAYEGSKNVKGAGERYLPRPAGLPTTDQYNAYLSRATWGDFTAVAVNGYVGAIFRKDPVVAVPAALEPQLEDVTLSGLSLRTFAEGTTKEMLHLQRFGILVDFPQPLVTADGVAVPDADARPYWVAYPTEEILNWRTIQRQGDTILSLVVLKEVLPVPQGVWPSPDFFVVQNQIQYRILRLNDMGLYEVNLAVDVPTTRARTPAMPQVIATWIPLRNGEPLDFIPFFGDLDPAKSLMEPLVEINYRYYRHSADYEHQLHWLIPTVIIASSLIEPQTQLVVGSSVALVLPGDAKWGILSTDPSGLPMHEHAMDTDRKEMAALGARLLESPADVTETRIAAQARTQGAESPIQSLISRVDRVLTQACQTHAWWANLTETPQDPSIHVNLNRDIVSNDMNPVLLTALMAAVLNRKISDQTWWYNLKKGEVAPPLVEWEEEQALIEAQMQSEPLVSTPPPPRPPAGSNGAARQPA